MKKVLIIQLLIAGFILHKTLWGQNDTLYFKHYSTEQGGLSQNNVTSIVQDSLGFMWYGTKAGLNKFDGYSFITYKHDPKIQNSLASDDISCMSVERSGIIWIGTKMKGVNRLNPYTGNFTFFQHKEHDANSLSDDLITGILVDIATGLIWIGTESKGLNVYNPKLNKFTLYFHEDSPTGLSDSSITCITRDRKGKILIGTKNGGLNEYDQRTKKFTTYMHNVTNPNSLSSNNIRDVYVDQNNDAWIATDAGLNLLNRESGTIKIFRHDEKNKYSLCSDDLTSVYQDKAGKIWIGTADNGLDVYYKESDRFYLYSHETSEQNTLSSNKINRISQGRSGMFWAATQDGGLNAFNPKSLKFKVLNPFGMYVNEQINKNIACIYECENQNLWITTRKDGLFRYNVENDNLTHYYQHGLTSSGAPFKMKFPYDKKRNGVKENPLPPYDLKSDKTPPLNLLSCAGNVYRDSSDIIWLVSVDKKLTVYDNTNNVILPVALKFSNDKISALMPDHTGTIWIGTSGDGLYSYNPETKKTTNYRNDTGNLNSIGSNNINGICEDKAGNIWVSTVSGGLNSFSRTKNNFRCYTEVDGLPANSIGVILADDNNNIWAATDNGICRLTFENNNIKQCRLFDKADGLPTTEFLKAVALKRKNGAMIFSCDNGLISFFPDSLKNNPYKPPVVITDFRLFNKSVLPGDSSGILKTSISVTREINLSATQNFFSFEFTAMSFINAVKNRYAYKMDGFDKDWIYTSSSKRFATYTNLAPGTYTFHVKASNNDDTWNEDGTSLKINIAAPYYKTWWFELIVAVAVAGTVYAIYRYRLLQLLKMQHVRNKIASDLHDDIGSGLSTISIFSEIVKQKLINKREDIQPLLDKIDETSRSLSESMHDIVWTINPKNDKFENVLIRMKGFAMELFGAKNIELKFDYNRALNDLKLTMEQRKNVYLIFKEAINNAVKYSSATLVDIVITMNHDQLQMIIHDNGTGFDADSIMTDGNGLSNMLARAGELGGELKIDSHNGSGTNIQLNFKTT